MTEKDIIACSYEVLFACSAFCFSLQFGDNVNRLKKKRSNLKPENFILLHLLINQRRIIL